jgi:DNA-binding CsgD family transcriptional regulator
VSESQNLLLIAVSLLFSAAVLGAIIARSLNFREPGLSSLLYPFIPLFLIGCVEGLRIMFSLLGKNHIVLSDISATVRMLNGLGWFLLCHDYSRLHGQLGNRRFLDFPVTTLTIAVCLAYIAAAIADKRQLILGPGLAIMSLTALYAAFSAILLAIKKIRLWPSSAAGLRMAIFGLIFYPASLIAERLDYHYPFLDPNRAVFEQLYPFFISGCMILAVPAVFGKGKTRKELAAEALLESLTNREKEVIALLKDKKTLKEIADQLSLSVPTVKSHSNSAYRKLGIKGRKEL